MKTQLTVIKTGKRIPSTKTIEQAIDNYEQEHQGQPVFLELLSRLGLLWDDWLELKENHTNTYQVRLLEMYHQHIMVQMEKMLVYQSKQINTGAIMFYLKKLNPNRYGDKVIELKTKPATKTMYEELKNESEIDLMKLSVC